MELTLKTGITIKELSFNELNKFHNILKETGARKNFKIRDINYYQDMYKLFSPKNEVKYLIAELNLNNYVENLEKEKQDKITKLSSNLKQTKKQELEKEIKNIDNKIKEAKKIKEKANNDIIVLSGSMFILTKPEIIYLSSGNYKEYLNFNSQYLFNI